jgi:hypothetical protein
MNPFVVAAIVQTAGTIIGMGNASNEAGRQRDAQHKLYIQQRKDARIQANLDLELARANREQNASIARDQLMFNQATAIQQAEFQNKQFLFTQEQVAKQEFENTKLRLDEQRAKDDVFYQTALRTAIVNEGRMRNTPRDTILTSPLGIVGSTQPDEVSF